MPTALDATRGTSRPWDDHLDDARQVPARTLLAELLQPRPHLIRSCVEVEDAIHHEVGTGEDAVARQRACGLGSAHVPTVVHTLPPPSGMMRT